jgi:hypothetical protein
MVPIWAALVGSFSYHEEYDYPIMNSNTWTYVIFGMRRICQLEKETGYAKDFDVAKAFATR